jgi:hypothetical protein
MISSPNWKKLYDTCDRVDGFESAENTVWKHVPAREQPQPRQDGPGDAIRQMDGTLQSPATIDAELYELSSIGARSLGS